MSFTYTMEFWTMLFPEIPLDCPYFMKFIDLLLFKYIYM